jgi:hemerythrin-like domain-containing protein
MEDSSTRRRFVLVIRRVLVVYRESAARLRTDAASIPADALQKSAKLLRSFGEDYHERQLEEAHIFPALKTAGGPGAAEITTLLAQHQRGRELTDWVLAQTARPIGAAKAEPLARALEGFARMYEEHAAREDTIVFPTWKKTLSNKTIKEMGEIFEGIEKKTFGHDGWDDAVAQVTAIEREIGLDAASLMPAVPRG